jgi:hypothetical protein
MLLLNSVEDVRIDHLCAPNMKKYIDKLDVNGSKNFIPYYEKGELDENKLMNIVYRLLYHHKGFIKDDYIDTHFGELPFILKSTPKEYIPIVFGAFQKEIEDYCKSLFQDTNLNPVDNASTMDSFIQQISEKSAEEAFEKSLGEEKQFCSDNFSDDMFEESEFDKTNDKVAKSETTYSQEVEEGSRLLVVPRSMKASIDIFNNVDVVDCHENFNGSEVTAYKTLLIG